MSSCTCTNTVQGILKLIKKGENALFRFMEIIADEHEGGLTTPAPEPPSHTLPRPTPLSMYNGNVAVVIFFGNVYFHITQKETKSNDILECTIAAILLKEYFLIVYQTQLKKQCYVITILFLVIAFSKYNFQIAWLSSSHKHLAN